MANPEDTELRDLVINALEKNGSLAKIRASLRANVFLAFEDECETIQCSNLTEMLKSPEGILCLNLVHELLEFLNLKNTLFVYTAETRQGKEYSYCGAKRLASMVNIDNSSNIKQPVLMKILKKVLKFNKPFIDQAGDHQFKDEQNCTYIVHDDCSNESSNDASSKSHSQSEQSTEEKSDIHLRLPLDQSDTDTSSDSSREKNSSEYIPNKHIVIQDESDEDKNIKLLNTTELKNNETSYRTFMRSVDSEVKADGSNESFLNLKPFSSADEKMLNTMGLPIVNDFVNNKHNIVLPPDYDEKNSNTNIHTNIASVNSVSSSIKSGINSKNVERKETVNTSEDYSQDFTSPSSLEKKTLHLLDQKNFELDDNKSVAPASPHQTSQSSQSSVSISDVQDLIEISGSSSPSTKPNKSMKNSKKYGEIINHNDINSVQSNHSDDYSDSPIRSISNLSLDSHSE